MQDDIVRRLMEIADELRSVGQNGLFWANKRHEEYDYVRYAKTVELASRILSMVDTRDSVEIERIFRGDLGLRSPLVGVTCALFDEHGRILLNQRADNGKRCMPGGLAEVGESPFEVIEREVWEETGLRVQPIRLIGIFDSRKSRSTSPLHIYNVDLLCRKVGGELGLSNETVAFGYFTEAEVVSLDLHGSQPFRVPVAFQAYRSEHWDSVFQ